MLLPTFLGQVGHEIPKTETETRNTKNRTKKYQNRVLRFLVPGNRIYRVHSLYLLGIPKVPKGTELQATSCPTDIREAHQGPKKKETLGPTPSVPTPSVPHLV
jgi:hypothetical protein